MRMPRGKSVLFVGTGLALVLSAASSYVATAPPGIVPAVSAASTTTGSWHVLVRPGLKLYEYHGASCVKGTTTCWLTGGQFGAVAQVVKTTNGGTSWASQAQNVTASMNGIRAISCVSTSRCVGVGGVNTQSADRITPAVVVTTNGGTNWTRQSVPTMPAPTSNEPLQAVACTSSSHCVAVGKLGVILETSNGSSWTLRTSGTTDSLYGLACPSATVCFAVGNAGTILRSTNGGSSWTAQTSGASNPLTSVSCPTTLRCFAVGNSGTIRATTNGGSTWTGQTSGTTNNLHSVSCPTTSRCVAVGDAGTVLSTTDAGTLWGTGTSGTAAGIEVVTCYTSSNCLAGTAAYRPGPPLSAWRAPSVLRSTTFGSSWTASSPGETSPERLGGFSSDPMSCPGRTTCYLDGSTGVQNGGSGRGLILHTTDGVHWGYVYRGGVGSGSLHGISCADDWHCLAAGYSRLDGTGVVLSTTNGGASWQRHTTGTNTQLWGADCVTASHCFVTGNSGTILVTTNGGSTWTAQTSGTTEPLYSVSCPTASHCFAIGYDAILATTNGGGTWTAQTSPVTNPRLYGVACHDSTHCVAVGSHGLILATSNGGTTWVNHSVTPPTHSDWDLYSVTCSSDAACMTSGGTGFYVLGHPPLILTTSNGGTSWTKVTVPSSVHGTPTIACSSYGCWAAGAMGAIISNYVPPKANAVEVATGTNHQVYAMLPALGSGWHSLGGNTNSAPAVAGGPLFFYTGTNGFLYVRSLGKSWQKLSGTGSFVNSPAATVIGSTLYVAGERANHNLYVGSVKLPASGLPSVSTWHNLGNTLSAGPAVSSLEGSVAYYVVNSAGRVNQYTGGKWTTLGLSSCAGNPGAGVAPTGQTTYVDCRGASEHVYYISDHGNGWSKAVSLGGTWKPGAGVAATNVGVFFLARASSGAAYIHRGSTWTSLGGDWLGLEGAGLN
jgi:photosystem II stability/assembly factor-like uncharacterized protein